MRLEHYLFESYFVQVQDIKRSDHAQVLIIFHAGIFYNDLNTARDILINN
jgi:hypothetical protein